MPKAWHDRHFVNKIQNECDKTLQRSIVADKKPYFMRYIYPALMKQYNTYIKNTDRNALREFQQTVNELKQLPYSKLTERQRDFLQYFDKRMPVGVGDCVMNKICRRFETEFDGYVGKYNANNKFDYGVLRSDTEYSVANYNTIKNLYDNFNRRLRNYTIFANYERIDHDDSNAEITLMREEFRRQCDEVCPNSAELCNIILDICYNKSSTKRFAWSMCGAEIIHNLLQRYDNKISFPTSCADGDIYYCGESFAVETTYIEVNE